MDLKKIEAMKYSPHPKNINSLHGFLGLTGYYGEFVHNYGKIATPLIALFKKNAFSWNETTNQSFQYLKEVICMTLVLALPEFTKICVLEFDASKKGIGAILMQEKIPLAFTSKQFF